MAKQQLFKAFLTGHTKIKLTTKKLIQILKNEIGFVTAKIPTKSYQGYAFVKFESQETLSIFLEKKHYRIGNNNLIIKPFRKGRDLKQSRQQHIDRKIFLHNIPYFWDDQDIVDLFSQYGNIEEAFICKDKYQYRQAWKTGSSSQKAKCIGFVVFSSAQVAHYVSGLKDIRSKGAIIGVKKAKAKELTVAEKNQDAKIKGEGSSNPGSIDQVCYMQTSHSNNFQRKSKTKKLRRNFVTENELNYPSKEYNLYTQNVAIKRITSQQSKHSNLKLQTTVDWLHKESTQDHSARPGNIYYHRFSNYCDNRHQEYVLNLS